MLDDFRTEHEVEGRFSKPINEVVCDDIFLEADIWICCARLLDTGSRRINPNNRATLLREVPRPVSIPAANIKHARTFCHGGLQ